MMDNLPKVKIVRILKALEILKKEGPIYQEEGICNNLSVIIPIFYSDWFLWVRRNVDRWPEFSGNVWFPIGANPEEASTKFYLTRNLWDSSTPYGQARYRLLDWMIEEFKLLLKTAEEKENENN